MRAAILVITAADSAGTDFATKKHYRAGLIHGNMVPTTLNAGPEHGPAFFKLFQKTNQILTE
jgi:hypothetical protein